MILNFLLFEVVSPLKVSTQFISIDFLNLKDGSADFRGQVSDRDE